MKYFQKIIFDSQKIDQFQLGGIRINYFGFKNYIDPLLSMITDSINHNHIIENLTIHLTMQKPILRLENFNFKHLIRDSLSLLFNLNKNQIAIHAGTGEKIGKVGRCEAFDIHIVYNYNKNIRIGYGFDRHQLIAQTDKKLILAGGIIDYHLKIKSHSDGDLILHVITDALLAAIGEGDIGEFFPENNSQWAGQNSQYFVKYAVKLVQHMGYQIEKIEIKLFISFDLYLTIQNHKDFTRDAVDLISSLSKTKPENIKIIAIKTNKGCIGRNEGVEVEAMVILSSNNR